MSWNIFGSVCGEADHDLRYADEVSQFPISGNPIRLAKDKTKNFNLWKMRDLNHMWARNCRARKAILSHVVYANDDFPDLELEYDHSKILCGETNTENLPGFVLLLGDY